MPGSSARVEMAGCLERVAEARGARMLCLPPYSPIKNCWSKIKTALRATKARTRDEPEKALTKAIELVTTADILGRLHIAVTQSHANENR